MDIQKNAHKTTSKGIILDMIKTYYFPVIVVDQANLAKGTPTDKGGEVTTDGIESTTEQINFSID
ncbi:MAG: hypothetical protein ACD_40C00217G0002 [uncultured bacterium]|nr:MAG: hypothetical protein ACD_40C00217G0002 [uncultured bacterium]